MQKARCSSFSRYTFYNPVVKSCGDFFVAQIVIAIYFKSRENICVTNFV